ncbi:threonine ammonia-lyase [Enterococcus canis]|uniref:threonine ammonia-lyase n=1 Tax=Enterococcus canis TaxID=214095 RepID=A0A1L8RKF9_9ENTE|nr:pyridoxal-phosphate dependent enzyme [Enterococcus canis]OJG20253.1 threonine ammonia-lyase [Enterococcus canis]
MVTTKKGITIDIEHAYERLEPVVIKTPLVPSNILSEAKHGCVHFKLENLQRTGSFKIRGAYNKLALLTELEKSRGVIACSAGNHAQGVAISAKMLGIKARIFMPVTAPKMKIEATRKYGAMVELVGENFDEAKQACLSASLLSGEVFIPPYDDPEVIAGQGTVAVELFQQLQEIDNILVPIGGGGLITGIAMFAKNLNPQIKIIGVQTYSVHGMVRSLWNHTITANRQQRTLADGCDVAVPGNLTFDLLSDLIDETVLVEEDEIKRAITYLALKEKIIAEGAGALTTAAILSGAIDHILKDQTSVAIVSGGNIDGDTFKVII